MVNFTKKKKIKKNSKIFIFKLPKFLKKKKERKKVVLKFKNLCIHNIM